MLKVIKALNRIPLKGSHPLTESSANLLSSTADEVICRLIGVFGENEVSQMVERGLNGDWEMLELYSEWLADYRREVESRSKMEETV